MDDGAPTRTNTRHARARRRRVAVATALVLALVLVAGIVAASCSGGDDSDDAKSKSTTTTKPETKIDIRLGDVSADSAGAPVTVSADQAQHVLDALTTYVKGATVQPLRSGTPATADFGAVFDPATLASATTTDRAIVLDEGLPKVTGNLTVTAQPVTVLGLGDQSGNLTLATASLVLDVTGVTKVKGDPLHVVRQANFVLQPDPSGTWKITSYDMVVSRGGAGLTPTTTTTPASTTTGAKKK
jgi:hypothetical protein